MKRHVNTAALLAISLACNAAVAQDWQTLAEEAQTESQAAGADAVQARLDASAAGGQYFQAHGFVPQVYRDAMLAGLSALNAGNEDDADGDNLMMTGMWQGAIAEFVEAIEHYDDAWEYFQQAIDAVS